MVYKLTCFHFLKYFLKNNLYFKYHNLWNHHPKRGFFLCNCSISQGIIMITTTLWLWNCFSDWSKLMEFSCTCDHNINMFQWLMYYAVNNISISISISTSFNNLDQIYNFNGISYKFNILKCQRYEKCDNGSNKININMTSMYNKLWKKQNELFLLF